jgi:hypothetical protein
MTNAADYVIVNGNMTVQSDSGNTYTAGTLEIKGNFTHSTLFAYDSDDISYIYMCKWF